MTENEQRLNGESNCRTISPRLSAGPQIYSIISRRSCKQPGRVQGSPGTRLSHTNTLIFGCGDTDVSTACGSPTHVSFLASSIAGYFQPSSSLPLRKRFWASYTGSSYS